MVVVKNRKTFFNKSKYYFVLVLTIEYWWILIELGSTRKSYTVPISLCSSSLKSCDALSKQKLYQLILSLALSLQIPVLIICK